MNSRIWNLCQFILSSQLFFMCQFALKQTVEVNAKTFDMEASETKKIFVLTTY